MAKFMLSLRDESFKLLVTEAEQRGISIQELIRAVIIPEWVKGNITGNGAVRALQAGTNGDVHGNGNNSTRSITNGALFQPTLTRVRG